MNEIEKRRRQNEERYTITEALQGYRGLLGMSQQQLADLTFELADQGIVTQGIVQQHISRIEGGSVPQEPTLVVLATTIAEALVRQGWETTPNEILKHLRNAKHIKVHAREVSSYAAQLDAIMAPLKGEAYTLFWEAKIAEAVAYVDTFRRLHAERVARLKAQEQDSGDTTHHTEG